MPERAILNPVKLDISGAVMSLGKFVRSKARIVVVTAVVTAGLTGGITAAVAAGGSSGPVSACYNKSTGAVRVLVSKTGACKPTEKPLMLGGPTTIPGFAGTPCQIGLPDQGVIRESVEPNSRALTFTCQTSATRSASVTVVNNSTYQLIPEITLNGAMGDCTAGCSATLPYGASSGASASFSPNYPNTPPDSQIPSGTVTVTMSGDCTQSQAYSPGPGTSWSPIECDFAMTANHHVTITYTGHQTS